MLLEKAGKTKDKKEPKKETAQPFPQRLVRYPFAHLPCSQPSPVQFLYAACEKNVRCFENKKGREEEEEE